MTDGRQHELQRWSPLLHSAASWAPSNENRRICDARNDLGSLDAVRRGAGVGAVRDIQQGARRTCGCRQSGAGSNE